MSTGKSPLGVDCPGFFLPNNQTRPKRARMDKKIKGVKFGSTGPHVTHLLFADDTLLFFEASQEQALHVRKALDMYSAATGQLLNYNKCSLFFGPSCPEPV